MLEKSKAKRKNITYRRTQPIIRQFHLQPKITTQKAFGQLSANSILASALLPPETTLYIKFKGIDSTHLTAAASEKLSCPFVFKLKNPRSVSHQSRSQMKENDSLLFLEVRINEGERTEIDVVIVDGAGSCVHRR